MPTQTVPYSLWSSSRISTPPPSTNSAVAATITLAAIRIEGGSRRNLDNPRSNGLGGASRILCPRSPASAPVVHRGVEHGRNDHEPPDQEEAEEQRCRD